MTVGIRQYSPLLEVWRKEALSDGAHAVSFLLLDNYVRLILKNSPLH